MFSPTLFWDYYRANRYEICAVRLVRLTQRHANAKWEVFAHEPGSMVGTEFGGLDGGIFQVWCVARKTAESTDDAVPQQGAFARAWETADGAGAEPGGTRSRPMSRWRRAVRIATTRRMRLAVATAYSNVLKLSYLNRFAFLRGPVRLQISLRRRNFGLRRIAKY